MKRFIVAVLALTLMFTEVLSPVQVNAVEKATQCEEKAFTVEPFIVGDEKLEGEGHPGEEIDLQFKDIETTIEVDDEGRFEHVWEEGAPEAGDVITLKSTPYKIELTVEAEMSEREELEAELVDTCEPAAPSEKVEGIEAEDSVEEEATEESSGESGEVDEGSIEEPSLGEESDPKEGAEETPEVGSTEEADLTEEPVVEASDETVPEEDGPAEEEASSEEPVEEKEEEMESVEAAPKEEEPEVEGKEDVKSEGDTDKETDIAKEEVANKQERTEEADSIEEASEEESEEETERILREESVEPENGMARSSMAAMQKISIESEVPITPTTSPVRVNTAKDFNDALSSRGVEVIVLGANIHTTSPPTVQSYSGQKIIETNGYNIDLGYSTMVLDDSIVEMAIRNTSTDKSNLYTTSSKEDMGFIKQEDSATNLYLENINFNMEKEGSAGKFGSNSGGTVHFYGNNVMHTSSNKNAFAFRKVIVHDHSRLELHNHGNSPALMFNWNDGEYGDDPFGIEVKEYGTLEVDSAATVMETGLAGLSDITFKVDQGANVILKGTRSEVFNLDTGMDFHISNPEIVDFATEHKNGRIFPKKLFRQGSAVTFIIENVKLSGWLTGNGELSPHYTSPVIKKGRFTFNVPHSQEETTVASMTPSVEGFATMFPPGMGRMVFKKGAIEKLKVEEIRDTENTISGTTVPNAKVTVSDVEGNVLGTIDSDYDGSFKFQLSKQFEAGTVLRFDAKLNNAASETVEKTVIGNRLEFGRVSTSIPFNTTEIKDEEMKIYRQNDNPGIEIVETRKDRGWKLSVEATSPLTNENQDTLKNALYYFSAGSEPELIEGTPFPVARGMTSETIEWAPDEGILLKLNPIRAAADTEYKTTIKWILSDGP